MVGKEDASRLKSITSSVAPQNAVIGQHANAISVEVPNRSIGAEAGPDARSYRGTEARSQIQSTLLFEAAPEGLHMRTSASAGLGLGSSGHEAIKPFQTSEPTDKKNLVIGVIGLVAISLIGLMFFISLKKGEEAGGAAATTSASLPAPMPSKTQTITKEILNEILRMASEDSWAAVNDRVHGAQTISYEPGDRKAAREFNKTGLAYFSKDKFDLAIEEFEKGTSASRGDIEIRNNLGYAELRAGRYDSAMPHLLDALLIDPTRNAAWINMAEAFAEKNDEVAATAALKLAVYFARNQSNLIKFIANEANIPSSKFRSIVRQSLPVLEKVPPYGR